MRMRGHAEHDDFSYVPREQLEYWQKRDPIDRYAAFMIERGLHTQASIDALRKEISEEMNAGIDEVVALPFPKPEEGRKFVFVD
jgi:TPP-dependent pyruvate/acetoin dehydrogenase alpha subunit